jgi:hypothetical protein
LTFSHVRYMVRNFAVASGRQVSSAPLVTALRCGLRHWNGCSIDGLSSFLREQSIGMTLSGPRYALTSAKPFRSTIEEFSRRLQSSPRGAQDGRVRRFRATGGRRPRRRPPGRRAQRWARSRLRVSIQPGTRRGIGSWTATRVAGEASATSAGLVRGLLTLANYKRLREISCIFVKNASTTRQG